MIRRGAGTIMRTMTRTPFVSACTRAPTSIPTASLFSAARIPARTGLVLASSSVRCMSFDTAAVDRMASVSPAARDSAAAAQPPVAGNL